MKPVLSRKKARRKRGLFRFANWLFFSGATNAHPAMDDNSSARCERPHQL
jgi:hypothetical protein